MFILLNIVLETGSDKITAQEVWDWAIDIEIKTGTKENIFSDEK